MDEDVTAYPTRRVRLHPCQTCGRQFNPETLSKHQAICRKASNKKRKVFDAGKQRATGSDVPYKATKKTAQIYNGEIQAQDDRSKYGRKPNWREKHQQLIQSIREARSVTRAMKQGGPLPAFRPSEVPSDYTNCPYCHRNFNAGAAERHIPFCQSQHERKFGKNARPNPQYDRGRTLPPQQSTQYREPQQLYRASTNADPRDVYNNGYKHSNSAPMIVRRNVTEYREAPLPPPRKTTSGGWGFRKLFGLGSKEEEIPSSRYYSPEDDYYNHPTHRPVQKPVLMRTGRTQENTTLNVRARQRNDEEGVYYRRTQPPPPPQQRQQLSNSYYGQTRQQYGNNQYSSTRPTAVGRAPPVAIRCGDCGSIFNNLSARYCPHCGSRC
ncbi:unnamed protein product [Adineta ricciae]|uniref:C2HC/C3H-type domain-containing protein n=2 Tax=Adineta ricciae TaxID=249248 RepID=A0A815C9T6_ADIRI|nr:unnamed protein product [Adineta ricciae]